MKLIIVLPLAVMLGGCAGDIFTTHQMHPDELRYVTDAQLCSTYNFRGVYSGATPNVVNEVRARNLDCNPNKISERVRTVSDKQ